MTRALDISEVEYQLIQVGELLTRIIIEGFTEGVLSPTQLSQANHLVSEWSRASQRLVEKLSCLEN